MTNEQILAQLAEIFGWRRGHLSGEWYDPDNFEWGNWNNPLTNKAQAFELMEREELSIVPVGTPTQLLWDVTYWINGERTESLEHEDLATAICLAVLSKYGDADVQG